MTGPTDRNRLDEEASPYLQQHADNPVNWQPWDDAALSAARENDRPIFLSIGYSACHWCHVMEEESFADEEVARLLNEQFVPIKVDREERPDLDSLYITVCQQVRGQAGWPLSAFLTPEGEPFYVGTYFPKEPKRGQPGFLQLLQDVAAAWNDPAERPDLEDRADQWAAAARGELEDVPDQPGEVPGDEFLGSAAGDVLRSADRQHGGFGRGQKFPQPGRVHLLLRAWDRDGREEYREVATETLDAMADRGLYDHLGGGFHRYCTDREWVVPHFEKMLYDQAEITRAFLAGYQVTGEQRYADRVTETLEFVRRELQHPDGGFYSTLDARSEWDGEQEEGAFYVWTPEQVDAAVEDDTDADLFRARYGVTEAGNFEGDTVLTVSASVDDLAAEFDLPTDEMAERLERAETQALAHREGWPRPARDEKVLAGWNGLMVSAFAEAGLVLDSSYAEVAADALAFVRQRLWDADTGTLHRRWKDGDVTADAYLEDYAFLARGALHTYEATGDVEHLAFALELARAIERDFWDPERETLYFTPASGEDLVARPQEVTDASTPSSTGVAVETLDALSGFTSDEAFAAIAERVVETHAERLESNPVQHAALTLAADALAVGRLELTVAADALPDAWRETLAARYLPLRLLSVRPPTEDGLEPWLDALGLEEAPPVWAGREARDGEPTVYACRSRVCSPPQNSLVEALDWEP
ncbi:thioredoxin domain-containing protein [Halorarius halobius]|uniref:thioredoxin domain-containing protein n=1 Tax=Halorarius halobius TaxID=2962671 RepID=UPI0020CDAC78|nr:thioredoxin domain-containing protein [Halorarius halobius]